MFHQHIFHLVRAYPVAAGFDDIVKPAVKPIVSLRILVGHVPCVIDSASPHMTVLGFVIQIGAENTNLLAAFRRDNDHFSQFSLGNQIAAGIPQFNVI